MAALLPSVALEKVSQMVWTKQEAVGYVPEGRHSHSGATIHTDDGGWAVIVFGGVVGGSRVNSVLRCRIGERTVRAASRVCATGAVCGPIRPQPCHRPPQTAALCGMSPSASATCRPRAAVRVPAHTYERSAGCPTQPALCVRADHACFVHDGCVYVHGGEVAVPPPDPVLGAAKPSKVTGTVAPSDTGLVRSFAEDLYRLDCGAAMRAWPPVWLCDCVAVWLCGGCVAMWLCACTRR